ncbi:arabinan endo-1,5-alpha-L-arabinosidase [Aliifodinibius sp. S!AR15-10]|uniref:arabinan endo-1,5-alpha-L-arabinosidase n=1 Tax=Aliifodinibius sp. S!AR15-10 TaxID=2950437 RepID=UPI00286FD523|nr:arabinan endo-1,5-alpha-L-arabinosidase [Aliifodinibius sp. S!AR15-10]
MNSRNSSVFVLTVVLMSILLLGEGIVKAQPRDATVHDPVMIKQDDTYYLFHTGQGISVKSSTDLNNWTEEDQVFESTPEWVFKILPDFGNHIWAPDIAYHDGKYYLYYSVSAFGRNNSAIGVATNTTLHPDDPDFEWVDHGPVVQSVPGRDMWNAIDPNLAFDDDGTPWMTFGSFWMGLKIVKLKDNLTEVVTDTAEEWHTVAARHRYWKLDERDAGDSANPELDYEELYPDDILEMNRNMENGATEAPFIFKKDGYYYLFISWDRCCRGVESTYKIMVGRSKDITGPYLDRSNKKLIHGGGTLVAKDNDEWAAVGHPAAYTFEGTDYLVFHGYDISEDGRPKLWISEITWDEEDWPQISLEGN